MKKLVLTAALLSTLTACQSTMNENTEKFELLGQWKVESIAGQSLIDYNPAQINFMPNNELNGNNSCNNFFGSYEYDGQKLTLDPKGMSMKACVDALMAQERLMNVTMPQVTSLKMEKGILNLLDAENKVVFTLTKM